MFGFKNDDLYNGYEFRMRQLGIVNLTSVFNLKEPAQSKLTGDEMRRVSKIRVFSKAIRTHIDSSSKEAIGREKHSVIYRTLVQELNHLAEIKADEKINIIYSDMLENSDDANFYSESGLSELKQNPRSVIERLQKKLPLKNLKGVKIYIVYSPKSYEAEQQFNYVISMYRTMLESKGAEVIVGANLITN
jgi:hypothetical protein